MRLFILSFLISSQLFAMDWSDLEFGNTYKLNQNFQLPQLERSHSLLDFSKGDEFYLMEIMPLPIPGNSVMKYVFTYKNCPGSQIKSDTVILNVEGASPRGKVMAVLEENCELTFFLEGRYYYSPSLFE